MGIQVTPPPGTGGGAGGGGGASEHSGDYARWLRTGGRDATTGSWDFDADLLSSSGATIAVDDSSEWIDNWGYAVPYVTEDGVYLLALGAVSDAAWSLSMDVTDAAGNNLPLGGIGGFLAVGGGAGDRRGGSLTLWLPAGTHFDYALRVLTSGHDFGQMNLLIQRVA